MVSLLASHRADPGSIPGHDKALCLTNRWSFGTRPKLGGPVYHNNIVGTLKIHLCPSHIGQVLRLPGTVSLNVLRNASLQVILTVPEVVDTEN